MSQKKPKSYWYEASYRAIERAYDSAASTGQVGNQLIRAIDCAWPWGEAKRTYRDWVNARKDFMTKHGLVAPKRKNEDENQIDLFAGMDSRDGEGESSETQTTYID